jgi:hypothetical protein
MPFEAAVNSTIDLIKSFTFSGLQKAVTADLPHEEEATTADLPHKEDEDVRVQRDGVFNVDPNIGDKLMDTYDVLFCDGEIHNYSKTELAELIITAREGIFQTCLVSEQVSESIFSSMDIR